MVRTLYRNASRRRTGIAERLLDETDRMSRLVLLDLLYAHLHMVEDEKFFHQCFRHIFEAHYRVYKTTGILHRDISTDNLMVRVGHDRSKQGVLIDWDLTSKATDEQDHTGTRTGTRAFMVYKLFDPKISKHILRVDWESFLYYLVWVVFVVVDLGYENTEVEGIQNETEIVADMEGFEMAKWPKLSDRELWREKGYAMSRLGKDASPRSVHRFHSTFSAWIESIWELFRQGHDARVDRDPNSINETLGGNLTYEGLQDILDREPDWSITERRKSTPYFSDDRWHLLKNVTRGARFVQHLLGERERTPQCLERRKQHAENEEHLYTRRQLAIRPNHEKRVILVTKDSTSRKNMIATDRRDRRTARVHHLEHVMHCSDVPEDKSLAA